MAPAASGGVASSCSPILAPVLDALVTVSLYPHDRLDALFAGVGVLIRPVLQMQQPTPSRPADL